MAQVGNIQGVLKTLQLSGGSKLKEAQALDSTPGESETVGRPEWGWGPSGGACSVQGAE